MSHRGQKQKQSNQIKQRMKKLKKQKNPYSINISFNINNPKKVISNQISKLVKINNYSLTEQLGSARTNKPNVSKVLSSTVKCQSTTLPRSRELSKYQCYLEEFGGAGDKKSKRSKGKPYDMETKSKSDFIYDASILNMPFPGDDPLPQSAVKKINKMKRYFLQKIGSMDITMPDHQDHSLETVGLKYPTYQKDDFSKKTQQKQQNDLDDDMITEKLSEYRYENLISYENQNQKDQSQNGSVFKSKQLIQERTSDAFPQIVIDSVNTMSIKNQYLMHQSKFIAQNVVSFKKQSQSTGKQSVNNRMKNQSFDNFSTYALKSKVLNKNQSTNQPSRQKRTQSKRLGSSFQNNQKMSQSRKVKEKIKIIHDLLLRNQSSRSILANQKMKIRKDVSVDSQVQEQLKNKRNAKQYVIKTEIQLPNDMIDEIKGFETEKSNVPINQQYVESEKNKQANLANERRSFEQFLRDRSQKSDVRQTKDLIQNYIDLLGQNIRETVILRDEQQDKDTFKEVSSIDQIHYLSWEDSGRQGDEDSSSHGLNCEQLEVSDNDRNFSSVSSYVYEGAESNGESKDFDGYSHERMERIQLQRKMKDEFIKRLAARRQKVDSCVKQQPQIKGNDTQKLEQNEQNQKIEQQSSFEDRNQNVQQKSGGLSKQLNSLLGFIKQKIVHHSTDKKILEDLYHKIKSVSNNQQLDLVQNKNDQLLLDSFSQKNVHHSVMSSGKQSSEIDKKTPNKQKFQVKNNNHRRSYSTQKYTNKIQKQDVTSDDLNYWDLILVEQKLNKKYLEISYEKQKLLFSIETDQNLTESQCQNKINDLNEWENQAKRQILMIKKEIKSGLESLRRIFNPLDDSLAFKMKSFSEKNLYFKNPPIYLNSLTSQQKNKPKQAANILSSQVQNQINNKENFNHKNAKNLQPTVQISVDEALSEEKQYTPSKERSFISISENEQNSDLQEEEARKIELFRTGNRKDLNEKQTSSPGSQSSGSSNYCENENQLYDSESKQKREFIDMLKIQKYRMSSFDGFQQNQISSEKQKSQLYQEKASNIKSISQYKPSEEDLDDICEFILLDLCIELYQQTLQLEETQIKKGKYQSNGSNRILNDVLSFIKKEKKKPKKKGPKIGIHTELSTVKQYVEKIKKYVQQLEDKSIQLTEENHCKLVINRINKSIGPTAVQILKTMRFCQQEISQFQEQQLLKQDSQNDGLDSLILPIQVFTDFEEELQNDKQFIFDKYFDDPEKEKNRLAFLKNVTHVHHKAIFDALNQMLDFQRPFGIWGKPFPWKKKNDRQKILNESDLKVSLKNSCQKVIQCAMYMCGLLVDKQESLIKNTTVSEAYIQEVKQDRMSKMIINDFLENESRFYFFDDEETQILLQTSYVIWVVLIQEALKQFRLIFQRTI